MSPALRCRIQPMSPHKDLDISYHRGSMNKPAVVLIHGLGMDKHIWINPLMSRILGGLLPLQIILGKRTDVKTVYQDLKHDDYSVITWSQKRPMASIDTVVEELKEIIKIAKGLTKDGLVIIGHSRGGLVARRYLLEGDPSIRVLITISTPHKGTILSRYAMYLSPFAERIEPLFSKTKGKFSSAVRRSLNFLKSEALKELLPDSPFFKTLKDKPRKGVYYRSMGGTYPTLFTMAGIRIPDSLCKVIPEGLCPPELKIGEGDGMVSAASSVLSWADKHFNFELNHADILFDKMVRNKILHEVERL